MDFLRPLGGMFQLGYVAENLEIALDSLQANHGITPELIFDADLHLKIPNNSFVKLKVALAWMDDCMIEVIEPVDGYVDPYVIDLPNSSSIMKFHHLGTLVDWTKSEWDEFTDNHRNSIIFDGGREEMRYVYLDCRDTIGHYVEYVWMEDSFLKENKIWNKYRMRQAALVKSL